MQGPWSQYKALSLHCEALPCLFDQPGRDANSTDLVFDQYSNNVHKTYSTPVLALFSFTPNKRVQVGLRSDIPCILLCSHGPTEEICLFWSPNA